MSNLLFMAIVKEVMCIMREFCKNTILDKQFCAEFVFAADANCQQGRF